MSADAVFNYVKSGNVSFPKYLLSNYKKMGLNSEEFIVLIYLINSGEKIVYDLNKIGKELNIKTEEAINLINRLHEKKVIEILVEQNQEGKMEDYISLKNFFYKLSSLIIGYKSEEKETGVFELIESEFGRTLSPIEYEIINAWLDSGHKEPIIKEAVKEAIYNGVSNLRYIDKILFEWKKKGLDTVSKVKEHNKGFKAKETEKKELFDYNWLEDNNEN